MKKLILIIITLFLLTSVLADNQTSNQTITNQTITNQTTTPAPTYSAPDLDFIPTPFADITFTFRVTKTGSRFPCPYGLRP